MAEEKKAVAVENQKVTKAEAKESFIDKCKKLLTKIGKPFKNMFYEMKKVTWPSKRKWLMYSGIVLLFMLFMAVVVGLFDMGSSALVRWLGTIAG